jgi:large-conductance mechanosensitive channel
MTLSPAGNYIFQVIKFHKTKSSIGFSNFLCLVTMLAHTTKIFFWFGERYVYTLLVQSILVILVLLYIIYLCVKFRDKPQNNDSESSSPNTKDNDTNKISCKESTKIFFCDLFSCTKTFNPRLIWRWDKSIEYYKFYFLILLILTGLLFTFGIENKLYAEVLGYMNLFFEMLCSLPQIVELCLTKNQRNISKLMVFFWFCGNVVKIYYNYYNEAPLQLILGGYIQVFFNIILICQLIYYYRKNIQENKNAKKETKDTINDDNSESHISIVRKTDVSENDETETDLLVDNKNKGGVKEEVELSKDNKTDIGEESEDEDEDEDGEENENEIILKNEGNVGNGKEEHGRKEVTIDLEDNK